MVQVLTLLAVMGLVMLIVSPALHKALHKARCGAAQLQDGVQLRSIVQGCSAWSQDNDGLFPIPELVDAAHATESVGSGKNRTGSVLSILIFNRLIEPEICVSPRLCTERNRKIRACDDFEYATPSAAIDPVLAVYDPAFRGSPEDVGAVNFREVVSHNSYAHMAIGGARLAHWRDNFSASTPIWANRGPRYTDTGRLVKGPLGEGSRTLRIHGPEDSWDGNIAYGDGRVTFSSVPDPEVVAGSVVGSASSEGLRDNIFVDETTEGDGELGITERTNAFLRIWKRGIPADGTLTDAHLQPQSGYVWID